LKILGVDPGLNTTGYGIIKTNKQHLDFITAGTITTKTSQPFPERLGLIKKSITGNGAASKKQVKYMVEHLLNTKNIPKSLDISDALATAITFFNQYKFKQLMN